MVSSSPLYTHCKLKCMSQAGCSHGSDGGPWAGGERRSEAVQGSPSSGCGFTSLGLGCSASPRCSHALAAPSCHQICQQDCLWVAFHDMRELILLRKIFIFYFVLCFFGVFFFKWSRFPALTNTVASQNSCAGTKNRVRHKWVVGYESVRAQG